VKGVAYIVGIVGALLFMVVSESKAQEQDVINAGKKEFLRSCAACHGEEGTGNGPAASTLNVKPADLTRMAARHGGTFLFWRTYEKIAGRDEQDIRGHGTREMPIWGERFRFEPKAGDDYNTSVRGRILSLVHYLQSIQVKE
jgi:mono/diheme cytochrome c family protein